MKNRQIDDFDDVELSDPRATNLQRPDKVQVNQEARETVRDTNPFQSRRDSR